MKVVTQSPSPRWPRSSWGWCWARSLLGGEHEPSDQSPEAGFARDMSVHHAQAVELAFIVRDRTDDPEVRDHGVRHHQHPARPDRHVQRLAAAVGPAHRPRRGHRWRGPTTRTAWTAGQHGGRQLRRHARHGVRRGGRAAARGPGRRGRGAVPRADDRRTTPEAWRWPRRCCRSPTAPRSTTWPTPSSTGQQSEIATMEQMLAART